MNSLGAAFGFGHDVEFGPKSVQCILQLASQRRLVAAGGAPIATGFADPYGLCMYRAPTGEYFVFANDSGGLVKQWRLQAGEGGVTGDVVREFEVGSQAEGCAADDELATYLGGRRMPPSTRTTSPFM